MKFFIALLMALLFLVAACRAPESKPLEPQAYLNDVLDWIQKNSLVTEKLDWKKIRETALTTTQNAKTTGDTYSAIRLVITELGLHYAAMDTFDSPEIAQRSRDGGFKFHGLNTLKDGTVIAVWPNAPAERAGIRVGDLITSVNGGSFTGDFLLDTTKLGTGETITVSLERLGVAKTFTVTLEAGAASGEPFPDGRRLPLENNHSNSLGRVGPYIGYIELPPGGNDKTFPVRGQELIKQMDEQGVCGWIVDLRNQNGGNVWGMTGAIGPIFGDGKIGEFVGPGIEHKVWAYRDGLVMEDDKIWMQTRGYKLKHPDAPVAVLASGITYGSGDMLQLALTQRPNTRIFSEGGINTATFLLTRTLSDGAFIMIEAGRTADRNGQVFDSYLHPDVTITTDWRRFKSNDDGNILMARQWLAEQPACKP